MSIPGYKDTHPHKKTNKQKKVIHSDMVNVSVMLSANKLEIVISV